MRPNGCRGVQRQAEVQDIPFGASCERAFSNEFRAALDAAGLNSLHFHGLRHSAGRALAEAGCSSHEIQSITGHRTLQMVEHYTKAARQKKLASAAIAKLEGTRTERQSGKLDE